MSRKLRLEFPGAMYQVTSRGFRHEDIFLFDVYRYDFLKTLAEASKCDAHKLAIAAPLGPNDSVRSAPVPGRSIVPQAKSSFLMIEFKYTKGWSVNRPPKILPLLGGEGRGEGELGSLTESFRRGREPG